MSRKELAEAISARVFAVTGLRDDLDEGYIGRLERGETRWPGEHRRRALREVLGASADSEIGLWVLRSNPCDRLDIVHRPAPVREAVTSRAGRPLPEPRTPSLPIVGPVSTRPVSVAVPVRTADHGELTVTFTVRALDLGDVQVSVHTAGQSGDSSGPVVLVLPRCGRRERDTHVATALRVVPSLPQEMTS